MKFKIKELKNILNSIQSNNINTVKVTSSNFELIINKKIKAHSNNSILKKTNYLNDKKFKDNNSQDIPNKTKAIINKEIDTYSTIISPMVGIFYRSPAPNEPAFVQQYDIVQKKQTVCIIEAMKLMNEIEAEVDGEIVEILVKDGEIVDCGQALMKVKNEH